MIRINLMKNLGMGTVTPAESAASTDFSMTSNEIDRKQLILKVLVLLVVPGLLVFLEKISLDEKRDAVNAAQKALADIDAEIQAFGDTGSKVSEFTEKKKAVERSLSIIKGLADIRLREVKTLDTLQSLLPPGVWLNSISISNGGVAMTGYSGTEEGLPDLNRALQNSVFFSNVEPRSATQENLPTGPVKKFDIEFKIGKAP